MSETAAPAATAQLPANNHRGPTTIQTRAATHVGVPKSEIGIPVSFRATKIARQIAMPPQIIANAIPCHPKNAPISPESFTRPNPTASRGSVMWSATISTRLTFPGSNEASPIRSLFGFNWIETPSNLWHTTRIHQPFRRSFAELIPVESIATVQPPHTGGRILWAA